MVKLIAVIIFSMMTDAPNRELYKSEAARLSLAEKIVTAGGMYHVDPVLLVVWANGESSLRPDAEGAIGEKGLMQVHGTAARTCKKVGLDLGTDLGQLYCGALLIDMGERRCGSLKRGLNWYAWGTCKGTPRSNRIVKRRLRQVENWNEKIRMIEQKLKRIRKELE